jgi:hypothetical protein
MADTNKTRRAVTRAAVNFVDSMPNLTPEIVIALIDSVAEWKRSDVDEFGLRTGKASFYGDK